MKATVSATLSLLLLMSSAFSQSERKGLIVPTPPSRPPVIIERRPPTLWINPDQGKLKAMEVQSVDVDIKVHGHLATTTIEMAFFNPNSRVLEGELIFPLGEGQTISGYALEVEGKLRKAVVVEKEKGREIFEEIVRRGVDPGLAELTKGNVFRTRVYPIPANGTKRLAVTFEQELSDDGKGFRYLLPLAFSEKVGKFHARVEVVKQENAPMPDADGGAALTFEKWRDSFVAELMVENQKHEKPLAFTVPKLADRPRTFLASEKLDPTRLFFHARVEPEVPAAPDTMEKPDKIALYYDASGSAAKRDRKREFDFLKAWLRQLGNVTVGVVAIRNDADAPVIVEVKQGDASGLIKHLEDLPLDGGTSLGAIRSGAVPGAKLAVVMSDGFSNFGSAEPFISMKDGAGLPFTVIHAASMVDTASLENLARRTGGRVVSLLTTSNEDALAALGQSPFQFLGAKVISGKVTDLAPSLPEPVMRGFSIAGRCEGKSEIELSFGYGGKAVVTRRLTLDPNDALEADRGDFVRRAWAQSRIAELALDAKRNESTIIAVGQEYSVVTAGTSLIVLDRMEDYVRHRIEPAEPDLREKYLALIQKQPKEGNTREKTRNLDTVYAEWEQFSQWHDKRHPWLETVLKPTAEREATLYTALSGGGASKGGRANLSAEDAMAAQALAERARDLASRWAKEGKSEDTRAVWIQEASTVMLAVDSLRQRRLELMPQSENASEGAGGRVFGTISATVGGAPMSPAAAAARPLTRSMRSEAAPGAAADSFAPAASPPAPAPATPMAAIASPRPAESKKESSGEASLSGSIEVKAWDPDTPYLKKLRKADDAYAAYIKERKDNASSSAFFLDCADFFREEKKDERLALRVLSNLAELELENAPLLRILAYRLQQLGRFDLAVPLFEEVLKMRGEEPQSRRDLALCLARMEKPDYTRAASLFWEVVAKKWDDRFPGISVIALHELNDLLQRIPNEERPDLEAIGVQKRFVSDVPLDLRVALTWDADNTDIDLWVIDPTGEVCIYNHNRTQTGGAMSNDFTRGYGPEIFTIRRALPGTYTVKVNYYGNTQQKLAGATTVQVEFQTSFDRPGTKRQSITRRLLDKKEVIEVGKFVFKPEMFAGK